MTRKKTTTEEKRRTLVLLDAHAILHRAYHALPDFSSPKGEPTGALYGVVAMLLKIVTELKPDYLVACYDLPEPTYRHDVFKDYKAGRAELEDGLIAQIERSRDIFKAFGVPIYERAGFEADDILGTIVEEVKGVKDLRTIIASGDMDTLQLVDDDHVLVYTLKKGINDTILYDEKAVFARFGFGPTQVPDFKGFRGDPSDNIPGIKGIGEKTATELIVNFKSVEGVYKALKKDETLLKKAGIKDRMIELVRANEEEAIFSKMLATIRRDAPIDFKLPETTWRDGVDTELVLTLFAELGFRTLGARVEQIFHVEASDRAEEVGGLSQEEVEELGLALWLLSSDTTNPDEGDIMQYGRANELRTVPLIRKRLMEELKKENLERVYEDIELPLRGVLHEMERTGVRIDVAHLTRLSKRMHAEIEKLEARMYELAGTEFNVNSPKQLGDVLYDKIGLAPKKQKHTATGQRSTRESELEKMRDQHPIIADILRYREVQKLASTYVDVIPTMVGEDGRVHTTFLQAGSVTGRMASQNPGVQNIPVRTEEGRLIRKAFVADPGFKLVSIDYSQVELRIAAILSGDTKLIEIFQKGEDVHQGVASQVFNVPFSEVTPNMRRQAKVINFGILYGMGVNALRQNLGETTTRAEAQEFYNAYFNTFTRLAEYLEETKAFARAHGYTVTHFGRKRRFPGMNSSAQFIRAQAERMAINAPVQGTAADVIRIAMVRIAEYLKREKLTEDVRMLLQVHDELVFEIREERVKELVPELKRIMETVLTGDEAKGVPIIAEAKVGDNWDEMEKMK
ncbi:MAG TPA: DNA polymerase [Candidatus Paceibacterota bacterium]|nr:DNA polymerase [Candidatus Paceibacterota bacterium]